MTDWNLPFYTHPLFLQEIENIQQNNLRPYYVVAEEDGQTKAFFHFQLHDFSMENAKSFIPEESERGGCFNQMISKLFLGKIEDMAVNLLVSGNIFLTGDSGVYYDPEVDGTIKPILLLEAIETVKANAPDPYKPNVVLVSDVPADKKEEFQFLEDRSYGFLPTEPDMWLFMDKNWKTFDDYLQSISSKYRVKANKVMECSADLKIKSLSLEQIRDKEWQLYNLYKEVADQSDFNINFLAPGYFSSMKEHLGDKFQVSGYYLKDELIGFTSYFNHYPGSLIIHYIGLNYDYNYSHHVYHRMLFEFIKAGISQGVEKIHLGRTATEIKTSVGAVPLPMGAYLAHTSWVKNYLLNPITKKIKPREYIIRNPFKQTA